MKNRNWIAPALLAPFAAVALARLIAPDAALPLVWIGGLTAWFFLPAWGLLAWGAARRRPGLALAAGLVCACHAAWIAPSLVPAAPPPQAEGAPRLRVVTANLLGVNPRPDVLVHELTTLEADVLILQEVSPRWVGRLEGRSLRLRFPHRDVLVRPDSFGIAILSRFPLASSEMVDLEGVPMVDATVQTPGGEVRVLGVHTLPPIDGAYAAVWRRQLAQLRDRVAGAEGPLLVAGDLNATSHAVGLRALLGAGLRDAHDELGRGLATTWPNGVFYLPPMRLDHVLSTEELVPLAVREGRGRGSDHRPVIVDLALIARARGGALAASPAGALSRGHRAPARPRALATDAAPGARPSAPRARLERARRLPDG